MTRWGATGPESSCAKVRHVEWRFGLGFGNEPGPARRAPLGEKRSKAFGKRADVVGGADLGAKVASEHRESIST